MKCFQVLWSPAIPLTSFHDLPVPLISSSIVLRHVLFGLPLLLYPWEFQSNAVFSVAHTSLRNVCPVQFHFLLFIWFSIGFCWVILHSSSFVILSVHFIFIVHLKHLFTNICNLVIWLVVFQVPQAYSNTYFTFVLNIRILTLFDMLWFLHTGYSWTNTPFAFLILLATSSSVILCGNTVILNTLLLILIFQDLTMSLLYMFSMLLCFVHTWTAFLTARIYRCFIHHFYLLSVWWWLRKSPNM